MMKRSPAAHTTRNPTVSHAVTWCDTTIPAMETSASANSFPRFGGLSSIETKSKIDSRDREGEGEGLVTILCAERIELRVRRIDEYADAASD